MPLLVATTEDGQMYTIDKDNFLVDGVEIEVELSEVIDLDLEGFLDLISERAGFPLLQQQSYEIIGSTKDTLKLRVKGDVSGDLDTANED